MAVAPVGCPSFPQPVGCNMYADKYEVVELHVSKRVNGPVRLVSMTRCQNKQRDKGKVKRVCCNGEFLSCTDLKSCMRALGRRLSVTGSDILPDRI